MADAPAEPAHHGPEWLFIADGRDWDAVTRHIRAAVAAEAPALPGDRTAWAPPALPAPPASRPTGGPRARETWACAVSYYGSGFHGFAWQKGEEKTVQGCLERAIRPLLGGQHALVLDCAGRTDAGVSATSQIVSFYSWPPIDQSELRAAVDGAAPGELRLLWAQRVPREFHATFSALWRRYVYLLPLRPGAGADGDVTAARLDAQLAALVGVERDYAALGRGLKAGKSTRGTLLHASARTVRLDSGVDAARIEIVGDRFLRRQVRTLVSTAVIAARDRPDDARALLDAASSGRPELTQQPAPAIGLCFAEAGYAPFVRLDEARE